MFINKNSNVNKAFSIFGVNRSSNNTKKHKNTNDSDFRIDCTIDDVVESQYISRNFQIGLTYVQVAKSTLNEVKNTLFEMKDIADKCKDEDNTSFCRDSLNISFRKLCKRFNQESFKLNIDIRENLFYNSNNELVFKIFDSTSLKDCILVPKLDHNKLNLGSINIQNSTNTKYANERMNEVLEYILSSEKSIKISEEKLSKVNFTDIMSENLLALSSNENIDSIKNLINLTTKGIIKDNYTYHVKDINKKNIDDLLK